MNAVVDWLLVERPSLPRNGLVVEGGLVAVDQRQVFGYHICQQLGKLTPLLVQFHSIVHGLLVGLLGSPQTNFVLAIELAQSFHVHLALRAKGLLEELDPFAEGVRSPGLHCVFLQKELFDVLRNEAEGWKVIFALADTCKVIVGLPKPVESVGDSAIRYAQLLGDVSVSPDYLAEVLLGAVAQVDDAAQVIFGACAVGQPLVEEPFPDDFLRPFLFQTLFETVFLEQLSRGLEVAAEVPVSYFVH